MAEIVNSNPSTAPRERDPVASRLISPTTSFFFCSNDDQLERAEARAARAATIRRKSLTSNASFPPPPADPCLSREQITDLFQTCIKLSSQNVCQALSLVWDTAMFFFSFD